MLIEGNAAKLKTYVFVSKNHQKPALYTEQVEQLSSAKVRRSKKALGASSMWRLPGVSEAEDKRMDDQMRVGIENEYSTGIRNHIHVLRRIPGFIQRA